MGIAFIYATRHLLAWQDWQTVSHIISVCKYNSFIMPMSHFSETKPLWKQQRAARKVNRFRMLLKSPLHLSICNQRTYLIPAIFFVSAGQSNWTIYLLFATDAWHPIGQPFSIWISVLNKCWMEKCVGVKPMNWKAHWGPDPVKHRMSLASSYSFCISLGIKKVCLSPELLSI